MHAHKRTDGTVKPLEELEVEYVELTDKLIYLMTQGKELLVNGEYEKFVPTKVIFLDKSARPLAWLTKELWAKLAPEPNESIPEKPDFKFLNIDREHWRSKLDPNGTGSYSASYLTDEEIDGRRSIFGKNHDGSFDVENELDSQVIMVVDELMTTGDTLDIATKIIKQAFPTSTVFGEHWMGKTYTNPHTNITSNADAPVWYKFDKDDPNSPKNEVGRGVRNRILDERLITHQSQKFLSQRWPVPDQQSLRLREDLRELASQVGNEVPYVPHIYRDELSRERRSEMINKKPLLEVELSRKAIKESLASSRFLVLHIRLSH